MQRIDTIRQRLRRLKADAFLCTNLSNVRYLTGFTGSAGAVLIDSEGAWFFTDFRYETQSAEQVRGFTIVIGRSGLMKAAAPVVRRRRLTRIAFEAAHVTVAALEEIIKRFRGCATISSRNIVESLRLVKNADEISRIRQAVKIADGAFDYARGRIRAGRSEKDIAFEIERKMIDMGAEDRAFDIIVASGVRSALPHGKASRKRIEKGDLVTLDFGAVFEGYRSDLTRTVCVGRATAEQQRVYRIVRDAQKRAEAAIRAGQACKDIDRIARDHIDAQGHAEHFGHGLGHGVGLDIHEGPRLARTAAGKLMENSTVTVEPGVYIPEWGGVRIEDLVLVRKDDADVLTRAPNPARITEV